MKTLAVLAAATVVFALPSFAVAQSGRGYSPVTLVPSPVAEGSTYYRETPPPVTMYEAPSATAPFVTTTPSPQTIVTRVPPPATIYQPVVPVVSMPPAYYLGRGIIGQPKLYVPNQPIRNFIRYLTL